MPADHLAIPAAGTVSVTGVVTSSPLGSSSSYWRKATLFVGLFPHMKIQGGGMEYRQKATTGEGGGQGWLEKWSATWAPKITAPWRPPTWDCEFLAPKHRISRRALSILVQERNERRTFVLDVFFKRIWTILRAI